MLVVTSTRPDQRDVTVLYCTGLAWYCCTVLVPVRVSIPVILILIRRKGIELNFFPCQSASALCCTACCCTQYSTTLGELLLPSKRRSANQPSLTMGLRRKSNIKSKSKKEKKKGKKKQEGKSKMASLSALCVLLAVILVYYAMYNFIMSRVYSKYK